MRRETAVGDNMKDSESVLCVLIECIILFRLCKWKKSVQQACSHIVETHSPIKINSDLIFSDSSDYFKDDMQ